MIVTALNNNEFYINQAKCLLSSLAENSPNDRIVAYLVNCPSDIGDMFLKINKNSIIENRQETIGNDVAGFMVCYRSMIVRKVLEEYKEKTAWFDNDIIVRKDLNDFWKDIKDNSLKIMCRNTSEAKLKFQAGIFGVGFSEDTCHMIQEWERYVMSDVRWYSDQEHLYNVYKRLESSIDLIDMDSSFNDIGDSSKDKSEYFLDSSHIWHCKSSHFKNEKFQKEYKKYISIAEEKLCL